MLRIAFSNGIWINAPSLKNGRQHVLIDYKEKEFLEGWGLSIGGTIELFKLIIL